MSSPLSSQLEAAALQQQASSQRSSLMGSDDQGLWTVPSDHFLAQQGSKAAAASSSTAASSSSLTDLASALPMSGFTAESGMPDTSTLAAADFDIDVRSGFLPPEAPLERLQGRYAAVWEEALDKANSIPLRQFGGGLTYTQEKRRLARQWRRNVREMAVLPLTEELLADIRHARRAHLVLSFLAHFYMHSQPTPSLNAATATTRSWRSYLSINNVISEAEAADAADAAAEARGDYAATVPASLAVPWLRLSQHLDLPPVLTYATTVLWNYTYIDPSKGLVPGNMRIVSSFTRTRSEEHFYLVSLEIELRGVEALELMRVSLDEAFVSDSLARRRIAHYLQRLAKVVEDLTLLLRSMRQGCDPATFYWGIRPWFRGGDSAPQGPNGEKGWHFQGVDEPGVRRLFTGPSAGQSSLIHALDVFLDVDHTRTKPRVARPHPRRAAPADARNERDAGAGADATFMERMQLYMPGHHRAFLTHLRNLSFDDSPDGPPAPLSPTHLPGDEATMDVDDDDTCSSSSSSSNVVAGLTHPIRSLALAATTPGKSDTLQAAYDAALLSLRALRDEHMRIATLYIISQARGVPPAEYAPLPVEFTGAATIAAPTPVPVLEALATAPVVEQAVREGAKGTGGTDLVSFLKDCRTNTLDALLRPPHK